MPFKRQRSESQKIGGHTLVMWEAVRYFNDKVKYFQFRGFRY